ncbi:MAG: hypothetical protein AAF614_35000 [Chloroflexota bacterium]
MQRRIIRLILLTIVLLLLPACLSVFNSTRYGSELELEGEAVVTCSDECSLRGQCGTGLDESVYVLGGIDAPLVQNHNRIFADNTAVTIKSRLPQNLQRIEDNQQFSLNFYEVTASESGKAGWIAGWCVAGS